MFSIIKMLKNIFKKRDGSSDENVPAVNENQNKQIVIKARNDSVSTTSQNEKIIITPKIEIKKVNKHTPPSSGTHVDGREVSVKRKNLGRGMTVNKQRKPGRCPICATTGGIIENPGGTPRWKCSACNETFN